MTRGSKEYKFAFVLLALSLSLFMVASVMIFVHQSASKATNLSTVSSIPDPRPNILLILTDDQRAGTEIGMSTVREELMSRGVRYTNAVVPTSVCCPSRATLLTGQYAHNTGVWDNHYETGEGGWPVFKKTGAEATTIVKALDQAGYQTGYFGKYLNDSHRMPLNYKAPGWDQFHIMRRSGDGYTQFVTSDGVTRKQYSTDYFGERTLDFLAQTDPTQPFFAMYAPFAPHSRFVTGPYTGQSQANGNLALALQETGWPNESINRNNLAGKPRWLLDWPTSSYFDSKTYHTLEQVPEAQMDTLQGVDANIARMLDLLEEQGRLENTLVIFTSDNGYAWGENRLRQKYTPHKVSTEVPLVLRWDAGRIGTGLEEEKLVSANLDIASTIIEATGAKPLRTQDGVSLFAPSDTARGIVLEATTWKVIRRPPYCGYRTADWMFVRYSTGEEELYHYPSDPWESENLAYRTDPEIKSQVNIMRAKAKAGCNPSPTGFSWTKRKPGISIAVANRNLYREYPRWVTPPKNKYTLIPGR